MYTAAMAVLVGTACAVPAVPALAFEQSLTLSAPLNQKGYAAIEDGLSAFMTQVNGAQTTATIVTQSGSRRLQAGSSLTISYTVACGNSCDAIATVRLAQPMRTPVLTLPPAAQGPVAVATGPSSLTARLGGPRL